MYKKDKFKSAIKNTVENHSVPDMFPDSDNLASQQIEGTKRMKNAKLIKISMIKPDPNQPRKAFPQKSLKELSESIHQHDVLQPITVEYLESDNCYQIISGERRFHAAKMANLTEIPCIIHKDVNSKNRYTKQLIENIQREDLSPIDKARALFEYKDLLGSESIWSDVEKIVGISKSRRKQFTALLNLPEKIQKEIVTIGRRPSNNNITEKHARALLILNKYPEKQFELFEFIKNSEKQITGDEAILEAKQIIGKKPLNINKDKKSITDKHLAALIALNNYPEKQKELLLQLTDTNKLMSGDEAIKMADKAILKAKQIIWKKSININKDKNLITKKHLIALIALNNYPEKQKELLQLLTSTNELISGDEAIKIVRKIKGENTMRVFRIKFKTDEELIEGLEELIEVAKEKVIELKEQYVVVE